MCIIWLRQTWIYQCLVHIHLLGVLLYYMQTIWQEADLCALILNQNMQQDSPALQTLQLTHTLSLMDMFAWLENIHYDNNMKQTGKRGFLWSRSLRKKCSYLEFCGQHFPAFGLNKEVYSVNLHIWSKCGKMRTRKTPNTDTLYTVKRLCMPIFSWDVEI